MLREAKSIKQRMQNMECLIYGRIIDIAKKQNFENNSLFRGTNKPNMQNITKLIRT